MKDNKAKIAMSVIALFVISGVAYYVYRNWEDFSIIVNIPFYKLLLMLMFSTLASIINGLNTKFLAAAADTKIDVVGWFGVKGMGGLIDTVLPMKMGSVFTAYYFKKFYKMNYSSYIVLATGNLVISIICQLVTVIFALVFLGIAASIDIRIVILLFTLLVGIFISLYILIRFKKFSLKIVPFKKYTIPILEGFIVLLQNKKLLIHLTLLFMTSLLAITFKNMVCFWIIGIPVEFFPALLYAVATIFLSLFTLLPGNWGVFEVTFGAISFILGDVFNQGVLISLINRLISLIRYAIISIIFLVPFILKSKKRRADE